MGYHSQSDECDDNAEMDMDRPLLSAPPTMDSYFLTRITSLLYMQMTFVVLSILMAAVALLLLESKLVHGLNTLMALNFISIVIGLMLLIFWGSLYANTLSYHLAFPYIEVHNFEFSPAIGYSYWLVLVAIIFSMGSMVMAFMRSEYLRREMLNTHI